MTTTVLPHDKETEQAVLGAILLAPNVLADIVNTLPADGFYQPAHQVIYGRMLDMYGAGLSIDPITVSAQLGADLERIGGAPYLHTLIEGVPTTAHAVEYAQHLAQLATRRRLITASQRIQQLAHMGEEDADALVATAQSEMESITPQGNGDDIVALEDSIQDTIDELDALALGGAAKGVPTGFHDLDHLTNGLHGGQMIIVAARPGVGKSTLGMDFMRSCSITHGKPSVIFSLEMSRTEITQRLLAAEAEVKISDMRAGRLTDDHWAKISDAVARVGNAPLHMDDSPSLTMLDIRAKARRLHAKQPLGLIVVDYLQLMSSGRKVESRQQEVSEFSRQLKLLAKELDVPVIAISQLNRGPEQRPDKKPQLSDLRESGSLEQDADIVMLLNRPDSQDPNSERLGEADIILAKHRGGPIDTIAVAHQLHYSRFRSMARS